MIPNKLILYTRPWETDFHIALVKSLKIHFPDAKVVFVTFFVDSYRAVCAQGYDCLLVQNMLDSYNGNGCVADVDAELRESNYPGINELVLMERFLPTHPAERDSFIAQHVGFLTDLIDEYTLGISSMYDHFFYVLAGLLTNSRKGWHFAFLTVGVPSGFVLALKSPWEHWVRAVDSNEFINKELVARGLSLPPDERIVYMRPETNVRLYRRAGSTIKNYLSNFVDWQSGNYFVPSPFNRIVQSVRTRFSVLSEVVFNWDVKSLDDLNSVDRPFVFLALHMEPEATILMYSPWLRDQIELVRQVSQALPANIMLLVKENPKMVKVRKTSYYKRLKSLPNVLLISEKLNTYEIIQRSIGVITLAGNASLEAALLGKPSMCFGKPPFHYLLNKYDISYSGGCSEIAEFINFCQANQKVELDDTKWKEFFKGLFKGNLVPRNSLRSFGNSVKDDGDTVENCVTFINEIIETN